MGKTKYLSAFEQSMVVGARRTILSESRTATLLGFILNISCVYQEWSTNQFDTTVGSIGVDMSQPPCGTLSTPCPCPDELRLF